MDTATDSVLNRLDRLDILIAYLQQRMDEDSSCKCKPLNSVLLETQAEGSIVQRLDSLETKLSEISQQLEAQARKQESNSKGLHDHEPIAASVRYKPNLRIHIPNPNSVMDPLDTADEYSYYMNSSHYVDQMVAQYCTRNEGNGNIYRRRNKNRDPSKVRRLKSLFCMLPVSQMKPRSSVATSK